MWHPDTPIEYRNAIVTGDARQLSERIPDESVDLIFTDPVYDRMEDYAWLSEVAARVLKPTGWCVAFYYTALLPQTAQAMASALTYQWQIIWHRNNEVKYRYAPTGKSIYVAALVYTKDARPARHGFGFGLLSLPVFQESSNHGWSKPVALIRYYLHVFTTTYATVLDPFTGGGTVPAVCKMLGRNYIAFEIGPATAELARERVLLTQPPLFVQEPEQAALGI